MYPVGNFFVETLDINEDMMYILSYFFIACGSVLLIYATLLLRTRMSPSRLSFQNYTSAAVKRSVYAPTRVHIPSIGVDLPVGPASVTNGIWEIAPGGLSFLTSSRIPGTGGNSVFYGHNWPSILGNLVHIQPGDTIEIYYTNTNKIVYTVTSIGIVNPDQTDIIFDTGDDRVTIYTCTGFLDSKRFVATATRDTEPASQPLTKSVSK